MTDHDFPHLMHGSAADTAVLLGLIDDAKKRSGYAEGTLTMYVGYSSKLREMLIGGTVVPSTMKRLEVALREFIASGRKAKKTDRPRLEAHAQPGTGGAEE